MSLTPFTGTVDADVLDANFDDKTAELTSQAIAGRKDSVVFHRVSGAVFGAAVALRTQDFVAGDDFEMRVLRVRSISGTAGFTVTARLEAADGDTDLLIGQTFSVSVTSVVGTSQASLDCRDTTQARRVNLLRGGRYRLVVESTGALQAAQVSVVLRSRRRRR